MLREIYREWARAYEDFEGEASLNTWRRGIVAELRRLGCAQPRILDLGAGTGIGRRVLIETFPGCMVLCLDQSAAMLTAGGVPPGDAVVADMSTFTVTDEGFDYVVSGFDALNCLPKEDLASCLRCVASALKPGGKLVFDYSTRKLLKYDWAHYDEVREHNGCRLSTMHRYEPLFDRTRIDLRLEKGEEHLWDETHYHYTVDPYALHELALSCGLHVLYGRDLERKTFSPSSTTHVWVFERSVTAR